MDELLQQALDAGELRIVTWRYRQKVEGGMELWRRAEALCGQDLLRLARVSGSQYSPVEEYAFTYRPPDKARRQAARLSRESAGRPKPKRATSRKAAAP